MPSTAFLRDLLVSRRYLSATEADQLVAWACGLGIDLPTALTNTGVLAPAGGRTVDLMRKGFITAFDPAVLFAAGGLDRLRTGELFSVTGPGVAVAEPPAEAATEETLGGGERVSAATVHLPSDADRTRDRPLPATDQLPIDAARPPTAFPQATPTADRGPAVGGTLGKCLLTGVVGKGGRGTVYSALHTTLNIPVAVKVLLTDDRDRAEHLDELRHEAQLLARLNHPNVVRVLDFDVAGLPYVVLEMVEGPSLADLIVQTGGLRPERAADVILQAARGLAEAWLMGIVHRDIKPGNLLLTRDGAVKVADLGLAMTVGGDADSAGGLPLGTCAYMAPEQARGADDLDFRADVYALGATFYHAVTGQLPYPARNPREMIFKHATAPIPLAHEAAPGIVGPEVSEVIARMMAKAPADRFGSYGELMDALAPLVIPAERAARAAQMTPRDTGTSRASRLIGMNWLFGRTGNQAGQEK